MSVDPNVEFFRTIPITHPDVTRGDAEIDVFSGPEGAHLQVSSCGATLIMHLQVRELEALRDAANTALLHQRLVLGARP